MSVSGKVVRVACRRRAGGPGGLLASAADGTFDRRRAITTLAHLRHDLERHTREDDMTHAAEAIAFRDRALGRAALEETGWRVRRLERTRPLHLLALAQRRPS